MTPTQTSAISPVIQYGAARKPPVPHRPFSDPNRLAPEDAFYAHSPPRRPRPAVLYPGLDGDAMSAEIPSLRASANSRRRRGKDRGRSGSRRGKGVWKKLLWVKQRDCMYQEIFLFYSREYSLNFRP